MGQSAVHRNGDPIEPSRRELALQIAQHAAE
jgi:hypothetical protein